MGISELEWQEALRTLNLTFFNAAKTHDISLAILALLIILLVFLIIVVIKINKISKITNELKIKQEILEKEIARNSTKE